MSATNKTPYHQFQVSICHESVARLRKADVAAILPLTFPNYKGRTFKIAIAPSYELYGYELSADGGTWKDVFCLRQIPDEPLQVVELENHTPWDGKRYGGPIPADVMIVERQFFCGQDMGLRFIVAPGSKFLPAALQPKSEVPS